MSDPLPAPLSQALVGLAEALEGGEDDWWIIGSAAVALHGAGPIVCADVDLLTTPDRAHRLAALWGVVPLPPKGDPLFRSEVYFHSAHLPTPVDVMAGFHVRTAAGWRPVRPRTRVARRCGEAVLYTPCGEELLQILDLFGRPKDRERARVLRRALA